MITAASYRQGAIEHEIAPHELLQMIGRAGRRGLDEIGYVLVSASTPRVRRAAQQRLKRAAPPPWAVLLRGLKPGDPARDSVVACLSARVRRQQRAVQPGMATVPSCAPLLRSFRPF